MIALDTNKLYSYADYLKWTFEERVELIKGKIFEMSPSPAPRHQRISWRLTSAISRYFEDNDAGPCEAFYAPFDVRLPKPGHTADNEVTTVVQPDLCIICNGQQVDGKGCLGAPDMIIEILSPGNSSYDLKVKWALYEEHGVKEYWVVAPAHNHVQVYLLNAQGSYEGPTIYTEQDHVPVAIFSGKLAISLQKVFG